MKRFYRPLQALPSSASLAILTATIWTAFWGGGVASAQPATERATLLQGEGRYEIDIALDQIGLVLRETALAQPQRLAQELAAFGLSLPEPSQRRASRRLAVAALDVPVTRTTLVLRARALAADRPELIEAAGLVIRRPDRDAPAFVTDQFIVQFADAVSDADVDALHRQFSVKVVEHSRHRPRRQLVAATAESPFDALELSNRYNQHPLVEFAHPNFVQRLARAADPLFGQQWHLRNTGQGGGTPDADVDADPAWAIENGDPDVLIAVLDGGFDLSHPDLVANLWQNPGEIPGNGTDDDGNGYIDDVHGWDFVGGDDNDPSWQPGDFGGPAHGTVSAGAAAARGDNGLGVSGSCPRCRFVPVRIDHFTWNQDDAFDYAAALGADIITASWGCDGFCGLTVVTAIEDAAANGRGGLGAAVFFAMDNAHVDRCTPLDPLDDYSSLDSVIAVSAVDHRDRILTGSGVRSGGAPGGAYGDCMDLLSPTRGGAGTRWGAITDLQGSAGYNDADPHPACAEAAGALDYTLCAAGTSFATPVAAGVGGLALSAMPALSRVQLQRLLQDTADKVQDSAAGYRQRDGFSSPSGGAATHGYGRVNAYEAVRVVAPVAAGGRGGVDVLLRDNRLDWGNTEQPSNTRLEPVRGFIEHWHSVDIKVDAPPFQPAPTDAASFAALTHQNPAAGVLNRVYVRVRNRGPVTAAAVTVKLHWAFAGAGLPALPADFWSSFPSDSADLSHWHPLASQQLADLAYSGASVAGGAQDAAQIAAFDFHAPAFDPSLPNPSHYCLFAVADSPQDPVSAASTGLFVPDLITPADNNVTHRNVVLQPPLALGATPLTFYISNPFEVPIDTAVGIDVTGDWHFEAENFQLDEATVLAPRAQKLLKARLGAPPADADAVLSLRQRLLPTEHYPGGVLGGLSVRPSADVTP